MSPPIPAVAVAHNCNLCIVCEDADIGFRQHCAGRADGVDAVPEASAGSEHRGSHGEPLAPQVSSGCG
jgi:hypothetical protein